MCCASVTFDTEALCMTVPQDEVQIQKLLKTTAKNDQEFPTHNLQMLTLF